MRKAVLAVTMFCFALIAHSQGRSFYQLKIYHLKTKAQEERLDKYLRDAWLPAVHRAGVRDVGVFKLIEQDTAEQLLYVLIPFRSLDQFGELERVLQKDQQYALAGKDYIEALYNNAPYLRVESILLRAFEGAPRIEKPALTGPKRDRIYELRSYEGPTERYFVNKVKMFYQGGEIGIFKRLGFNAIFYAEVLSGTKMPNLMYMTSFENKASRDEHWKAFSEDAQWKRLREMSEFQNNVSKIDISFLYPVEYSDF